jgi:hypothetical protein
MVLLDGDLEVVELQFTGRDQGAEAVVVGAVGKAVVEGDVAVVVELGVSGKREQENQRE